MILLGPTGNLLIDCTPEMRLQITGQGITDIDAVVITHTHADHFLGMDDLRTLCLYTKKAVPVYTLPEHAEAIRRVFPYAFQDFPPGILVPRFDLIDIPDVFEIGGMEIQTFLVDHGSTRVIGIRVNDFAYITDVSFIPPAAEEKLRGLDVLVIDAVRFKPHPNHFHLEKAIEVASQIGAKRTCFTHLSDDYDHDVVNQTLPTGMELAFDGMRIAV